MTTIAQYRTVARGLLERESAAQANGAADTVVVGEAVLQKLHQHLARWLGNDGSHTVSARALAHSRVSHPILSGVRMESRDGRIQLAALDSRESFYRLIVSLTALGVTVLSTVEVTDSNDYLRFSPYNISFLTDDIIAMRYVENRWQTLQGPVHCQNALKQHSRELRRYELTLTGMEITEAMTDYRGIITGVPERKGVPNDLAQPVLTSTETMVLDAILQYGESSIEEVASNSGVAFEQVRRTGMDGTFEVRR